MHFKNIVFLVAFYLLGVTMGVAVGQAHPAKTVSAACVTLRDGTVACDPTSTPTITPRTSVPSPVATPTGTPLVRPTTPPVSPTPCWVTLRDGTVIPCG